MFKQYFYITMTTLGGALLGFLLHALLELWYIPKLVNEYQTFGAGLSWQTWFRIHELLVVCLTLAGGLGGIYKGRQWWKYIYVDKRYNGLVKHIISNL